MKFNPTFLEILVFLVVCLFIFIWTNCGHHSERLHERLFHPALSIGHLQLDELVPKVKQDAERIWVWTAVAARSKLILALHIGRRSSDDSQRLLHQVWQRLGPDSLPIFTSDGLNQYFYGVTAHFGFWEKPPRARKYHWFADVRLQYAQLRKRRRGWRVTFLYSIIRLGSRQLIQAGLQALSFSGIVQTAFVERANLTLRELIAPLSRRTWSIAYDKYHLRQHIQWGLAYYHFLRHYHLPEITAVLHQIPPLPMQTTANQVDHIFAIKLAHIVNAVEAHTPAWSREDRL